MKTSLKNYCLTLKEGFNETNFTLFLFNITFIFSQPYPKISISVDSTKVKIGQEISYQIKINLDTINEIKFNKNIFFSI